jgi:predicted PurR-regulated permease PerM
MVQTLIEERGAEKRTEREPEKKPGETRATLLAVIATVLVLAFLKWSQAATVPVAFAVFLIAIAWPVQEKLERRLPRWASFLLTILLMLAVLALFVGALWWSTELVSARSAQYMPRLQAVYARLQGWAAGYGFDLSGSSLRGLTGGLARSIAAALSASVSGILLILALAILGLHEVRDFRDRARHAFRQERHGAELVETIRKIATQYQEYLWALTVTAILQGVTVGLFSLLIGLDFPFVWGLLAFVLNYVPTVGSTLAVIPPTLFALVQFDGFGRPLAVFLGMAALQLIMGNYVDPLIQGKYLSMSPVVILTSIVFWGWLWGVPGALLGVPITVGIVIASDHFPKTRWIARLLSEEPSPP